MKKNVIWWIAINNPEHRDKYGNFEYFEYSKTSWQHFCQRHNCEFVEFTDSVEKDFVQFRPQWQKIIFVFDELERRGIEYDQIALVDSSGIVRWNCPNFFELTQHKFTAWKDIVNLQWTYESIVGYRDMFPDVKFDNTKYFNSGFMIFNESHKQLINSFKEFYLQNKEKFIERQDKTVRRGNDQTPLNYWIQKHNVELNLSLPVVFNLTHLHRSNMFMNNFTLNEDTTPFFIKYGYHFRFTGIPKDQRTQAMKTTWELIKHNYKYNILDIIKHKDSYKNTTTRKFKEDVIEYFKDKNMDKCIELGGSQGNSTFVYATLFKSVTSYELSPENTEKAKSLCQHFTNIDFIVGNVYQTTIDFKPYDVAVIDAGHASEEVDYDLQRVFESNPNITIIIDDYGHIDGTIKHVIDEWISSGRIEVIKFIGEDVGFVAVNGKTFVDKEGLIFKFKS